MAAAPQTNAISMGNVPSPYPSALPAPGTYQYGMQYSTSPNQTGNSLYDSIQTPGYVQAYDPSTMSQSDYLSSIAPQYDQGFNAFRDQALSKGPSNWLTMSGQGQDLQSQTAKESAQREANASTAQAQDQLAMKGGLSSGARERTVESGQKNLLGMEQDINRTNNQNKLNLGIQDQSNKLSMLGQLPGMENQKQSQWMNAKNADITNQTAETGRLNSYNQNLYDQRMQAAASERQAEATENSGKGGK